jgi:excinuclease ABC subunit A
VVVIEHNLEVIKTADWVLDLGPKGGDKRRRGCGRGNAGASRGRPRGYTGHYLKPLLQVARADAGVAKPKRRRKAAAEEREAAE